MGSVEKPTDAGVNAPACFCFSSYRAPLASRVAAASRLGHPRGGLPLRAWPEYSPAAPARPPTRRVLTPAQSGRTCRPGPPRMPPAPSPPPSASRPTPRCGSPPPRRRRLRKPTAQPAGAGTAGVRTPTTGGGKRKAAITKAMDGEVEGRRGGGVWHAKMDRERRYTKRARRAGRVAVDQSIPAQPARSGEDNSRLQGNKQ